MSVAAGHEEAPYPRASAAWTAVVILGLATVVGYLDRQIIYLLVGPLRKGLGISDSQIAVLQGLAFALFFTVFALPFGWLVDRRNRRNIVVFGLFAWSAATIACAFAQNFWELFAARAAIGIGEACLAPASYSLLADYFPRHLRGRATAAVTLCATIGSGAAFFVGGWVLGLASPAGLIDTPLLGQLASWKVAFIVGGLPGPVIALITLAIREPARHELAPAPTQAAERSAQPSMWRYLLSGERALLYVFAAGMLLGVCNYGVSAWAATFLIRHFGMHPADVGWKVGLGSIIAGAAGGAIGGPFSDWLAKRRDGGRIDVFVYSGVVIAAIAGSWTFLQDANLAILGFSALLCAQTVGVATTPAIIQEVMPNQLRGRALAAYFLVSGVTGAGLGPLSVASVTQYVFHDDAAIGLSLAVVSAPITLASAVVAFFGRGAYQRAYRALLQVVSVTEAQEGA